MENSLDRRRTFWFKERKRLTYTERCDNVIATRRNNET